MSLFPSPRTTLHLRPSHCRCLRLPQYSSLKYDDVIATTFVPPAPAPAPYRTGMDRQQWYMFWADNFTRSEYVGFVDADTLFITYVDREGAWARLLQTYMAFERCPDLLPSQTCLRTANRWCTAASAWTRPPRGSTPLPGPRHVFFLSAAVLSWHTH